MPIRTKSALKALFETGDTPSSADFTDFIESNVVLPASFSQGILEVETTASTTIRPYGSLGIRLIEVSATAQLERLISTSVATEVLRSATTASAVTNLGFSTTLLGAAIGSGADNITTFSSGGTISGLAEVFTGHIESPSNKQYTIDRYAAYPYNIEWITVKTSAGRVTTALKVEGSAMAGITALKASATEVRGSAGAGKSVAVGNTLILECSGNSSGADLVFTIKYVRTP